ncbi:hypothetical protein NL676_038665 [Syzygium grande]|nr:hypothetical protein NL676_038665 [Syzygium grande]
MEARQTGHGFNPREEELVGHFLRKKLKGQMEANCEIPELFIYDWEPPDLFILYDVLSSEPSDGRECFFFCPRGRKRKTKWGFWKETGIERVVRADTGKPMGTKRYFVYYEGRQPKGRWTDVMMREYHLKLDVSDSEISDPTALSNLNSAQATPGVTIESDYPTETLNTGLPDWNLPITIESDYPTETLNTGLPDWNLPIPDQQPQTCKEQCLCYDDNWHVDVPSDGHCYIPYSLSDGINVTDLLNSDESTGQTQTCKEQHLAYDDNQHVDGPSNERCDTPNSPSGGIDLEDLLNSD